MDAPGTLQRMTIADRRLARRSGETQAFAARLAREPGITCVVFEASAGTLWVTFDPDLASPTEIRDRLRDEGLGVAPSRGPAEQDAYELVVRFGPALPRIAAVTAAILRA